MSKVQYSYIPLDKASIIARRHPREVTPPGMVNIENAIPARSDASITLRPDWIIAPDVVYGFSGDITLPGTSIIRDALNSASGLYGSDQLTYFTTFIPYGISNGVSGILSDTHNDGTISLTEGESAATGSGTRFLEKAYRGAVLKVPNSGTSYSGSPYLWTNSPNDTDEYYMTTLAAAEVPLLGIYMSDVLGGALWQGTAGSLDANASAAFGDTDSLGFTALYVRGDPSDSTGDRSKWLTLVNSINISGANHKWTASGSGTNEYYVTERDGTVPLFVPDYESLESSVPLYIRIQTNSFAHEWSLNQRPIKNYSAAPTVINDIDIGTVSSLANQEWGIGDADSLGFTTVYYRGNAGDPDTSMATVRNSFDQWGSIAVGYYKDISQAGNYTWNQSAVGDDVYYLKLSGGTLGLDAAPLYLYINESRALSVAVDSLQYFVPTSSLDFFGFGDATLDELGYDTIYTTSKDGNPSVTGSKIEIAGDHYYPASMYSWAVSAGGTNEYFLKQQDGSEITAHFVVPKYVAVGGSYDANADSIVKGTIASLNDQEWGFGRHGGDSLTYDTIYVRSDAGDPDATELQIVANYEFELYASKYKWTEGGTSDEWYITLTDGSDPSISSPVIVEVDGYTYTEGTLDSLVADEWDYGDSDTLGFSTIYIYSTSTPDGAVGTGTANETKPFKVFTRATVSDFDRYVVDHVTDDRNLSIYGEANASTQGVEPTFYYNHNPFIADYKLNIQAYTSGLIYCGPTNRDNINEEDICGPFYAALEKGDWKYSGYVVPNSDFRGTGVLFEEQPVLATNTLSYVQIFPDYNLGDDLAAENHGFIALSYGIERTNAWSREGFWNTEYGPTTIQIDSQSSYKMVLQSIKSYGSKYLCATIDLEKEPAEPGIMWSTDSFGLTWDRESDSVYKWDADSGNNRKTTDYGGISAAANNSSFGRIVVLYHRNSDDRVVVRYTDDSGSTFNDTNIGGNTYFTGSVKSKVDYFGNQFVITIDDGIYYGDGTSFTKKTITGATQIRSIAFNGSNLWGVIEEDGVAWYSTILTGTWSSSIIPRNNTAETNWILYDTIGERFVVNSEIDAFWTDEFVDDNGDASWSSYPLTNAGDIGSGKEPTNIIEDSGALMWTLYDGGADYLRNLRLTRYSYYWWDVTRFVPISDMYRSSTFSVLDGYVVLIGTSERDPTEGSVTTEYLTPNPAADGTLTSFTFPALEEYTDGIVPSSVTITATLDNNGTDNVKTFTDNGSGSFFDPELSSGFISYTTGVISLTFSSSDLTLKASSTIGVAYDYNIETDNEWTYYPRRIRWTAPKTYNDFNGVGSGTANANGDGAFLDARSVNGRIVVFETNDISAIVPRGNVADPWDFDVIKENIRFLSNPIVVDDFCYFIASDGLLWKTDGISATEAGASFDITEFDDFTEDKPISLDYSRALNSLIAYFFDSSVSSPVGYMISLSTGAVTKIGLPVLSDDNNIGEEPKYLCAVADSSDQRVLVSYHPDSGDTDAVVISYLDSGAQLTGVDYLTNYWYTTIETGEFYLVPEGKKTSLHSLIVRTYSDSSTSDNDSRPYITVEVKSLEDSDWHSSGDAVGTATMTTTALTGSGTAWSTTIAGPNSGSTQQKCNGSTTVFTLPCLGAQARVYLDSTLQTAYTTSGKTITFTTAPGATKTLYVYWDAYPEIKIAVGDHFKSTEGFHRVTAIDSAQDITLDHYLSTGSETVTHYPCTQMPDGEGETKIGIRKLVEGVLIRLYVIPEYGSASAPTIVKITGLSIGHIPRGRKILEATGS